ncbi:AraC family transcriptional regulator [Marinobacter bryozoorum]|uniref:helix-turn-helix transcriptional regulator n=1 Tax=Marinobacter bryozoorum TaxID=256324 RepID=UPI002002DF2A|nr:AraC family transcriptional regulator [Marinobacter bryozoorum]MCK7542742.1 AraC family transcriptional regulator [Marinobacter bryozoorum]
MSFTPSHQQTDSRLMLIGDHRVFYYGLLGRPGVRNFGCATLYVSERQPLQINFGDGWQTLPIAWVAPYTPHRIRTSDRHLAVVMLEPEYTDTAVAAACIRRKLQDNPAAVKARILEGVNRLQQVSANTRLSDAEFDDLLFGQLLPRRSLDPRVGHVVDRICENTADPCSASLLAEGEGLSLSRFLHLFKAETGVCLRKYRAWRRARTLLYHVRSPSTLTDIALETGYPDSTHFSHSIRRIYGLPPRDIVSGSRRLRVRLQVSGAGYAEALPAASARKLPSGTAAMVQGSAFA